jgi:hypothetical protein
MSKQARNNRNVLRDITEENDEADTTQCRGDLIVFTEAVLNEPGSGKSFNTFKV